mmetsp:Transcript_38790/g.51111  ORF Transcript_38790/g.51111 Transcript_38790/m.51111 type:complete len:258 (-) Transcript_38790:227-1000(-)
MKLLILLSIHLFVSSLSFIDYSSFRLHYQRKEIPSKITFSKYFRGNVEINLQNDEVSEKVGEGEEKLLLAADRLRKEAEVLENELNEQNLQLEETKEAQEIETEQKERFLETLVGTKWELTLDIGREKGTWMPPQWGAKGTRVEVDVEVEFTFDETKGQQIVTPIRIFSNFGPIKFSEGPWRIDGQFPNSICRFNLGINEFVYDDIFLPEGKIYFNIPCWGSMLSKKTGGLSVRQKRWLVRDESRMLGIFTARELKL